jgi:hypothetical protein
MKKTALLLFFLMAALILFGCAAATRMIDYGSMKTDVAMSESIFLTPTEAPKTIFIQIRNTSSNQNITSTFQSIVLSGIQGKGYQIVQKPSDATYILQANIRYSGEWKQGMNWEGTLTGAGLGALAGLGIGAPHHYGTGAAVGGILGAGVGFAADILTRVRTEIMVIEFQITERLSEVEDITGQRVSESEFVSEARVLGGMGTRPDAPTSKMTSRQVSSTKAGTKIYNAGVAARAAQVNLNVDEATVRLIENAGRQIAGIF